MVLPADHCIDYDRRMRTSALSFLLLSSLLAAPSVSANEAFAQCLARLEQDALERGLDSPEVRQAIAGVSPVERVLELDRSQPEFAQTFWGYFDQRVNSYRIETGRVLKQRHEDLLEQIHREFGVPGHYLLAFWGLETNFGGYFGNMPVLNSLATLACDERRSEFFSRQFVDALEIIHRGDITAEAMRGSWAGAMGHTQFMPSVYLEHAIDYDDSGQTDLWGSIPDALASAANYLRSMGWRDGERWGREVQLPEDFDFADLGLEYKASVDEWASRGVRQVNGQRLPRSQMPASLLLPAGHRGPAFLVYDNFHIIMRWNRSTLYALSVGVLADRINGAGGLTASPPQDTQALRLDEVREIQERLNQLGFDAGVVDGMIGPATQAAIARYQRQHDLISDGFADQALLQHLRETSEL